MTAISASTPTTLTVDASTAVVLTQQASQFQTGAVGIIIDSDDLLEFAAGDLRDVKALQKRVEEARTSITGPLNKALDAVNALFKAPKDYLVTAETSLKRAISCYQIEQEAKAAKARAEADALAAVERARLEAEALEHRKAAEEAQQEAQAAVDAGDVEAASEAAASAHLATMHATAAELNATVVSTTPAVAAPAKVSGLSGRTTYAAEVVDLMALVKAVAEGAAPLEAITADAKFLGAQARAFKKAGALYPGVNVKAERSVAARAA